MLERDWLLLISAFFCAFSITLVSTPFAKTLAVKWNAIDKPKARGMHRVPLPRLGGLAIVAGFTIAILIMMPFLPEIVNKEMLGFFIGAAIIVVLGVVDDIKNLRARYKLVFQIIAALACVMSGIRINFVLWPFDINLDALSVPITFIWIIGVTNAVNLIDGLDGLAAGVSTISAICLAFLCILSGSTFSLVIAIALAGACLGFLPRNFNPSEIIMGDSGSTFLGYTLAVTSVTGLFKGYALIAILLAVLPLALPIFDTLFAMTRRIINKKPIMQADRGHLHHRLIDSGLSQKQAVVVLYIVSFLCCALAIVIALRDYRAIVITVLSIFVLGLMSFVYSKRL